MKMRILSLLRWAGVEVDCEVFNVFSGLIPQLGLSRLEQGRKRQGLVPDFRVRVPAAGGGEGPQVEELVLAELKVISCCPTRYQRDPRATIKAVDRRAVTLPSIANMPERLTGNMEVFQRVLLDLSRPS